MFPKMAAVTSHDSVCLIESRLALTWREAEPKSVLSARSIDLNNALYAVLLKSFDATKSEIDADDTALARVEAKLDLIIQMITSLSHKNKSVPELSVQLYNDGLSWLDSRIFETGKILKLSVFLDPALPLPLEGYAEVVACAADRIRVAWIGDDQLQNIWSRWVFRLHRHAIAQNHLK